jgi:hypothetical protein
VAACYEAHGSLRDYSWAIADESNDQEPDHNLGGVLSALHDAQASVRCVEATYRVWHHTGRSQEAFVADVEKRNARSYAYSAGRGTPEPDEHEETVRIWRDGEKIRVENHGGQRDGYYAVAVPPLWWMWDEGMGARSNEDDPSVGNQVGQELEIMLDPTSLLSSLRFHLTGRAEVAGRATFTARATPRPVDDRFGPSVGLGSLGTGADYYELEIDRHRGALLTAKAFWNGQPFRELTAVSVKFDEVIAPEVFRFKPPAGERVEPLGSGPRVRRITLVEAQQQTQFTVLMPDSVPENWQVQCRLVEPSRRPQSSMHIGLIYRSTDGHETFSITETAADAPDRPGIGNEEDWETMARGGRTFKTRPASWGQAQVRFERDGTYVNLMSDNLSREQLVNIAAEMRPAPTASSI